MRARAVVLGRPGAGCTTFLRTLANQRGDYHAVEGDVHYDSLSHRDIEKYRRGDVQYCPEDDLHFPTLTVEQTLQFAAVTRTPYGKLDDATRRRHVHVMTDVLKSVFGLRHVQDTLVGDASIRGVSGGEKKRVSISETLATRSLLTCWDKCVRSPLLLCHAPLTHPHLRRAARHAALSKRARSPSALRAH